jgi:hypothetical protein
MVLTHKHMEAPYEIVRNLLDFSKTREVKLKEANINDIVRKSPHFIEKLRV